MYGETLARCTRTIDPLDFSGRHRVDGLVCSFGFGSVICMCKAKVLTCIAPEARRGLPPLIFQSVIACVPTGWSHPLDSSITPISIYYGHMIALEGVATSEA
jgi:hypothetical protein